MGFDGSVIVPTWGESHWIDLAHYRAIPSVERAGLRPIHVHGDTLAGAMNEALEQVDTTWVCGCDADDQLDSGYWAAMMAGTADARVPKMAYVHDAPYHDGTTLLTQGPRAMGHKHRCGADCLLYGNWACKGTMVRTELLRRVGGWRDLPIHDDWELWLRLRRAGATFEPRYEAIYRAYVYNESMSRAATARGDLNVVEAMIRREYPEVLI